MRSAKKYAPHWLALAWFATFSLGMYIPKIARTLGFLKGPKPFMDLQGVLVFGDCYSTPEVPLTTAKLLSGFCDPWNRPLPYPLWIAHLVRFLHLSNSQSNLIGWINAILIAISIGVIANYCRGKLIWFVLAAFAPPVFFLAERGNIDSIIYFFALLFIWGEARNSKVWHVWIPGLLIATKIYPLGLLVTFNKLKTLALGIIFTVLFTPLWVGEVQSVLGNQPHSRMWSYGDVILLTTKINQVFQTGSINFKITLLAAIAMLVIWLGCYFAAKLLAQEKLSEFVNELENSKATSTLFLSGSAIFVFSYLGISMGDYKLWTGLLIAAGLARLANPVNKEIKFLLLTPLLVGMWGSRFAPNWMEYVGDFSLLLLSCGLFVITFEYMRVNLQRLRLNSN